VHENRLNYRKVGESCEALSSAASAPLRFPIAFGSIEKTGKPSY